MNYYIKLIALSLIIGLSACEKDADVKLPTVESKLVVSSFISPMDTIIKVNVTLSQPLYNNSNSNNYSAISNATVQINDGTNSQTLAYNATDNYYFANTTIFPLSVGTTYYLTVTTPDGKSANASTSIPNSNQSLSYSAEPIVDPNNSNRYFFNTEWNDPSGVENYYRIVYYDKYYYDGALDTSYYSAYSNNISDKDKDGSTIAESFEIYASTSTTVNNANGELQLIHASKEYYLYHSKLLNIAFSSGPFSEPVQMYTNINGGYGVFAGYNPYKVHVYL
ncbi:MAG: DUF4249 domain-containing protein [Bacteroidia bacterium]|nr:DUF4249 domain-containing protein [Bacteroidia bacterium]